MVNAEREAVKLTLRLPKRLHKAIKASCPSHLSLNAYIIELLSGGTVRGRKEKAI